MITCFSMLAKHIDARESATISNALLKLGIHAVMRWLIILIVTINTYLYQSSMLNNTLPACVKVRNEVYAVYVYSTQEHTDRWRGLFL